MPERLIPISESEQRFARLVERVFTDEEFAASMESDPEGALRNAGIELDESQRAAVREARRLEVPEGLPDGQIAVPLIVAHVVRVATGGTRPVVRVATGGTRPVVSVAVGTRVPVAASTTPEFEAVPQESEISRGPGDDTGESGG